jgi:hypothetical protein
MEDDDDMYYGEEGDGDYDEEPDYEGEDGEGEGEDMGNGDGCRFDVEKLDKEIIRHANNLEKMNAAYKTALGDDFHVVPYVRNLTNG